ncbi:putative YfiR family protein [Gammaproteobacteria bacterium]
MERITLLSLFIFIGLGVLATNLMAIDEATVKSAYLYNFAKYTQWPDEQRTILRLCAMGDDTLGKSFDDLIGKQVRNMQISVRHALDLHDIAQCDLVFVPAGPNIQPLDRVRQAVNGYPILIVTESIDALPKGALVALIQSGDRIVFEVDLTAARQLGLQISGKMLQIARKVY